MKKDNAINSYLATLKKAAANKNSDRQYSVIERMDFDLINDVCSELYFAFHANQPEEEDEDVDPRFLAVWGVFLATVGWTEEEYWEVYEAVKENDDEKSIKEEKTEENSIKSENINNKELN
jgi:hypothetical protein